MTNSDKVFLARRRRMQSQTDKLNRRAREGIERREAARAKRLPRT